MGSHKIRSKKVKHGYLVEVFISDGEFVIPLKQGIQRFFDKYDSKK